MFDSLFQTFIFLPAHAIPGDAGAIEGFLHPLLGLQHLLAMVAVGLLSAQIGGRAIWTVPLAFVSVMVVGGIAGIVGTSSPIVAYGIAISVLLLGLALLIQRQIPEALVLGIVGIFALFHGYAHGEAIPPEQTIIFFIAYIVGFLMSTVGLHIIGALIGFIAMRSPRGVIILRVSGGIIALLGVFFLINA